LQTEVRLAADKGGGMIQIPSSLKIRVSVESTSKTVQEIVNLQLSSDSDWVSLRLPLSAWVGQSVSVIFSALDGLPPNAYVAWREPQLVSRRSMSHVSRVVFKHLTSHGLKGSYRKLKAYAHLGARDADAARWG